MIDMIYSMSDKVVRISIYYISDKDIQKILTVLVWLSLTIAVLSITLNRINTYHAITFKWNNHSTRDMETSLSWQWPWEHCQTALQSYQHKIGLLSWILWIITWELIQEKNLTHMSCVTNLISLFDINNEKQYKSCNF